MEKREKTPLKGVRCIVNKCEYHEGSDRCMASYIEVAPKNASTFEQTDCSTFCEKCE